METDKITSSYRVGLGEAQTMVDVTLQNAEEESIVKILSNCVNAYIDEIEMLNGEAHYMGGVVFDVLFLNDKGATQMISETADLDGKIQNDRINPLMKPVWNVEVVNTKVYGVEGSSVKVSATISIKLDAIQTDEVEQVKVNNESIMFSTENTETNVVVASGTKTFEISEEYETKLNVEQILCTKAHVDIKDVDDGTGYFSIGGNLYVNSVLQTNQDEEHILKNFMETISFNEELEDEQIQKGDNIFAFAYVKPQDLLVEKRGEEDNQTVFVKATVTVKYIVQRMQPIEVCTDAFSMTNKTNILSGTFIKSKPQKLEKFTANLDGQTMLNDEESRIAKICAVTNEHILIANSLITEGELNIEGVAYATIIYQTDDEIPSYASIDLEIPFAQKFDVENDFCGDLFVTGEILDVDTKVKRGKEINLMMEVCFWTYAYECDNQAIIKDIELAETLPKSEYSLEMYIAPKGSTLWDISKHLLVSEDIIKTQNPELEFPLTNAQTIVYFKQKS